MENDEELCLQFCDEVREKLKRKTIRTFSCVEGVRATYQNDNLYQIHGDKLDRSNADVIHINKMPFRIWDYLLEEGLAQEDGNGPWINMKAYDAEIYMAILAKYLAKVHKNTEIGTDIIQKFRYPYIRAKKEDSIRQSYLDIAMHEILPIPSKDVSIQDILDFKIKYEKELCHFRRRIDKMQWELRKCPDVETVREGIVLLQREIEDELREIENLMKNRWKNILLQTIQNLIPLATDIVAKRIPMIGETGVDTWVQQFLMYGLQWYQIKNK